MRFSLFVLILSAFITSCSSTPQKQGFSLADRSLKNKLLDTSQKKHFIELDRLLAKDIKSRDLLRAKHLVLELKRSVPDDHSRYKELLITEQWINESIDYQSRIKSLMSKIVKQNKALEQVRRTLVSE